MRLVGLWYVPDDDRARTVRPQIACKMRRTRRRVSPRIMAAADDAREGRIEVCFSQSKCLQKAAPSWIAVQAEVRV